MYFKSKLIKCCYTLLPYNENKNKKLQFIGKDAVCDFPDLKIVKNIAFTLLYTFLCLFKIFRALKRTRALLLSLAVSSILLLLRLFFAAKIIINILFDSPCFPLYFVLP